jgi:hypothetical protein
MLVNLSNAGVTPTPINFAPAAVYRNMWFVPASRIEELGRVQLNAEDVRKYTTSPEVALYLYLQKQNMPGPGSPPLTLPLAAMDGIRRDAETGRLLKIPEALVRDSKQLQENRSVYRLTSLDHSLEALWPTLKVHPFLYTNTKTIVDGIPRDLVVPLVPFGLYVRHEGAFTGFQTSVKLDGKTLTESGALVVSERRPVAQNPTFDIPVVIETMDVDGGAGPDMPTEGGAPPDVPPDMSVAGGGGAVPGMTDKPCQCRCSASPGAPGGLTGTVVPVVGIALFLSLARRLRRRHAGR